jgi:hypothetical protein
MAPEPKAIEQAVAALLEADESSDAPRLAKRELVRRVVAFANTGEPKGLPGARALILEGRTFWVTTEQDDVHNTQAVLQKDLAAIVKGELSAPAVARLRKQARYVTVRSYVLERGAPRPVERLFVKDLAPVLADVLLQVRGDEQLQKDVRQCRLPGCDQFFLASDQVKDPSAPGRRRHRYCSDDHMAKAQTSGAERTRRWRENKSRRAAKAAPKNR